MDIDSSRFLRPSVLALLVLVSLGVTGLYGQAVSSATPITDKNWVDHPLIKEIRVIFSDTEQAITSHRLVRIPMEDPDQEAWGLDAGHIRKFTKPDGGEDSALTYDHYYDPAGTLRFVFVRANAVNGTKVEYRLYFDERGQPIWENRKQTAGPGYTFPQAIPLDWLVISPDSLVKSD